MAAQARRRVAARRQSIGQPERTPTWDDAEVALLGFFRWYRTADDLSRAGLLSVPWRLVQAVRAARLLPVLTADIPDSVQGRVVREGLAHLGRRTRKTGFIHTPLHEVASVLILPRAPHEFATGASKQTVRRKSRAAERAGVHWTTVDDPAERLRLIALSEARERNHPQERYRSEDVDNSRLRDLSLWLVAYAKDETPVLIAAVPVDGEWSVMTYFRTLEDSRDASNARYLMSDALVQQLVVRGVRYLADTATMSNLPDGLRHFQRMLGYRVVRVRVSAPGRRRRPPVRLPEDAQHPASEQVVSR